MIYINSCTQAKALRGKQLFSILLIPIDVKAVQDQQMTHMNVMDM